MIEIQKGKEPSALMTYRKTVFATYADMPKATHQAVLDSLMQEQGYLCAYCMRRIPQTGKDPAVTIEHWDAQCASDNDRALDYRNMLAVCNGSRGCSKKVMTCDARRGREKLTVNPLNPRTLQGIAYKSDGTIYSSDEAVQHDLQDTLNLNCEEVSLVSNRRKALQEMIKKLQKDCPSGEITRYCSRLLEQYRQSPKKTPYVGILMWWLEKKIRAST